MPPYETARLTLLLVVSKDETSPELSNAKVLTLRSKVVDFRLILLSIKEDSTLSFRLDEVQESFVTEKDLEIRPVGEDGLSLHSATISGPFRGNKLGGSLTLHSATEEEVDHPESLLVKGNDETAGGGPLGVDLAEES